MLATWLPGPRVCVASDRPQPAPTVHYVLERLKARNRAVESLGSGRGVFVFQRKDIADPRLAGERNPDRPLLQKKTVIWAADRGRLFVQMIPDSASADRKIEVFGCDGRTAFRAWPDDKYAMCLGKLSDLGDQAGELGWMQLGSLLAPFTGPAGSIERIIAGLQQTTLQWEELKGLRCVRVEGLTASGGSRIFWLAPDYRFLCLRSERTAPGGRSRFVDEVESAGQIAPGVWMPTRMTRTSITTLDDGTVLEPIKMSYRSYFAVGGEDISARQFAAPPCTTEGRERGGAQPSCGLGALATFLSLLRAEVTPERLASATEQYRDRPELSMKEVADLAAGLLGKPVIALKGSTGDLLKVKPPVIALVESPPDNSRHFVVLERISLEAIRVIDRGRIYDVSAVEFGKTFTGMILALEE
jgi:hypothetical protein